MSDALTIALGLIREFEGCRLEAYPDPATGGDPWTIGWGATGTGIGPGVTWTQEEADARLARDAQRFLDGIDDLALDLTAHQRGALTSFAYNVGASAVARSTMVRLIRNGDHDRAADELMRWTKAGGREMPGLVRRRGAERAVFLTPDA